MSNEESGARCKPGDANAADAAELEVDFHCACYRFSAAIATMRIALTAADRATETGFLLGGQCTPEKLHDLQARRTAASRVMHEAIDAMVKEGVALQDAMQSLLSA